MARNNCISMVVLYANYLLALVGLVIAGISVWVAANSRNGGIAAFTFVAAILLKAPVALGICLLIAALASILTGLVFGARHVSPSIVEGLQLERRNAYLGFQAIATLSIALYAMVLFSAIHPLHQINREGITPRRWREMATKHPDRVCSYQVENDCSGLGIHSCSSASAIRNPICPGHFCKDTCKVGSLRPPSNLTTCRGCVNSFKSPEPLKACRAAEAKRKSQGSCIARLKGDLRRYFVIVTVASSIGMGLMLLVAILGTLSPVLSTKM